MAKTKTRELRFASPLRYPGGKGFLASEFARIINAIGLTKPVYIEPYAGGAGAALALLYDNCVESVVINDKDIAIYSFWKAVTEHTESFLRKMHRTPVTVDEWRKQKAIYDDKTTDILKLGYATFFLNRTNRSGVMNAWPIGGIDQTGDYKIDARFNKTDLAARIRKIGDHANRIEILNEDGIKLTKRHLSRANTFIYLDPPYFNKGAMLYMNHYIAENHEHLAELLNDNPDRNWILTYDETKTIRDLYPDRKRRRWDYNYRVSTARRARELMIFSDTTFT